MYRLHVTADGTGAEADAGELVSLGLDALRRRYRARELSPVEVMEAVAARIERQYPDIYQDNVRITATAVGLMERTTQNVRLVVLMLFGAVGLVLLIACVNIANLQLTRAAARRKEIAIRSALGASPRRIARQTLTESLLLALIGGVVGSLIAAWALDLIVKFGPENVPRLGEVRLDPRALGADHAERGGRGLHLRVGEPEVAAHRQERSGSARTRKGSEDPLIPLLK